MAAGSNGSVAAGRSATYTVTFPDCMHHRTRLVFLSMMALGAVRALAADPAAALADLPFPRLMGMNIGRQRYDEAPYQAELARLPLVIVGFYQGWKPRYGMAQAVQKIKELSGGKILIGQYTVLNEVSDDPANSAARDIQEKLNQMNWWARDAAGNKVQWTAKYHAWDINFTAWSPADANGQRYPEWFAERNKRVFFDRAPFDLWYLDNLMSQPFIKQADWDRDGHNDDPKNPEIAAAYRAGQRAQMDHIRRIQPGIMLYGNVSGDLSEPEWKGQLEGAFMESVIGLSWSIEKNKGWAAMMRRYRSLMQNTRSPHLVGFNVKGTLTDFQRMRYGLASCLLDDGYFCYTDEATGYSSVPWFDEFDCKLGRATSAPPTEAWTGGVWRRDFEHGVVLVNPTQSSVTVEVGPGLRRLRGTQDGAVNNGTVVTSVVLASRDGIVLARVE